MNDQFRMDVERIFFMSGKTVFAGALMTSSKQIKSTMCRVLVDGTDTGQVLIEGEVMGAGNHRDLWTKSKLDLDQEVVRTHKVQLVSP